MVLTNIHDCKSLECMICNAAGSQGMKKNTRGQVVWHKKTVKSELKNISLKGNRRSVRLNSDCHGLGIKNTHVWKRKEKEEGGLPLGFLRGKLVSDGPATGA